MEHRDKKIHLTAQEAELLDCEQEMSETDALRLEFVAYDYANVKSDIITDLLSSGSRAQHGMVRSTQEKLHFANRLAQELGAVARKTSPDLFPDAGL